VRKRAESRIPAIPITRWRGNWVVSNATWHIASSGLVTTMTIASGERSFTSAATPPTISLFFASRSSRLIPGWRGNPDVITTMSEPEVSS
jgi:hypothetical protein